MNFLPQSAERVFLKAFSRHASFASLNFLLTNLFSKQTPIDTVGHLKSAKALHVVSTTRGESM